MAMSPSPTFDGKKRLYFRDDMENYNINKWNATLGVASYVNTYGAWEGSYVLQIVNAGGTDWEFGKVLGVLNTKASFEVNWDFAAGFSWMQMVVDQWTGVKRYRAQLSFHNYTPRGYWYLNAVPQEVPIMDDRLNNLGFLGWSFWKLYLDLAQHKYIAIATSETNDEGVEIESAMSSVDDTTSPHVRWYFQARMSGINQAMIFDDARVYLY